MKSQCLVAAEVIEQWVASESLNPGTVLPSGRALAARFGLTLGTVCRACLILVSRGSLQRNGYKLTVGAPEKGIRRIEGPVYLVSYYDRFNFSASRILAERGVSHLVKQLSWTKDPNLGSILRAVMAKKPAGVILAVPALTKQVQSLVERSEMPMVVCTDGQHRSRWSMGQNDFYRGTENALTHLYDLGHRHIAHLMMAHPTLGKELAECFRIVCLKLNLKPILWKMDIDSNDVAEEAILQGKRRNPEVTALFGPQHAAAATRVFAVPQDLSVVVCLSDPTMSAVRPALTGLEVPDPDGISLWACTEMISQLQTIQSGRPPKPSTRAFFVPELVIRESTQAPAFTERSQPKAAPSSPARIDPPQTWRNTYPFLKKAGSGQWLQLDLSRVVNHSMKRQNGWLGDAPLEHFSPGLHPIHGVPFQILDEERNEGHAVVTFRSPHSHSAGKEPLPTTVRVDVGARVKALYFLHGCGYAKAVPFAEYVMRFEDGATVSVPLIPLGSSRQVAQKRLGTLKPNLQDWWPEGFEHDDFPQAHRAIVFNPGEPGAYERFLYSLEWINPRPDEEISFIEARVDPQAGPALALIAATAWI